MCSVSLCVQDSCFLGRIHDEMCCVSLWVQDSCFLEEFRMKYVCTNMLYFYMYAYSLQYRGDLGIYTVKLLNQICIVIKISDLFSTDRDTVCCSNQSEKFNYKTLFLSDIQRKPSCAQQVFVQSFSSNPFFPTLLG